MIVIFFLFIRVDSLLGHRPCCRRKAVTSGAAGTSSKNSDMLPTNTTLELYSTYETSHQTSIIIFQTEVCIRIVLIMGKYLNSNCECVNRIKS